MKNKYEIQVRAQCPVNPKDTDLYSFTLFSETIVKVEDIIEFFAKNAGKKNIFQEELTRSCAVSLGVHAQSIGWHSGIKITCEAP